MKKRRMSEILPVKGWFRKMLRIMRLSLLLICWGFISVSASTYSQNTRLDVKLENASIRELFKDIKEQSEFTFVYNVDDVEKLGPLTCNFSKSTVEEILDYCLTGTDMTYVIRDKVIIISSKERLKLNSDKPGETEQPQKKQLSGTVKDTKGYPIPGVTVLVKGTTIGTLTDNDGSFKLSVPTNSEILVFSFIGMKTQEFPLAGKTTFSVVMAEEAVGIEEVVAVGYGIQKKASVVGAITQTDNTALKRAGGVTDLKQALTGNLPGVITMSATGEPGGSGTGQSATSIFIRGQNTWNGGQPLILVDGVERNMENIDANEVETISVLKDASATAVFGVKGANGVILITTKRGTTGKPQITFSYNATTLLLPKFPSQLDAYNTFLFKNEAIEREVVLNEPSWADYQPNEIADRYKLPQTAENALIYPNIDWTKALYKNVGMSHHANMSVQGGTNFVNYFGSFAFLHEGDMFKKYNNNKGYDPNYNFDRFNFRSNFDFKLTKTTKLTVNLAGYYSKKNTNFDYVQTALGFNRNVLSAPYGFPHDAYLPQYPDGRWGRSLAVPSALANPVAAIYNLGIRENRQTQLNTDFAIEQKLDFITKGLSTKASLFYDNTVYSDGGLYDNTTNVDEISNTPQKYVYADLYTGPGQDSSEYTRNVPIPGTNQFDWEVLPWSIRQEVIGNVSRRLMYQFQLNYTRNFGPHNVTAIGLVKREEYVNGSEFSHFREDWVSRVTYDYDARYLFEINGAYNGSEQFGPGYRFGFFPSLAAGWVVSNEKFFKVDWINRLKIRASTGKVGNDNADARWLYSSQYSYGGAGQMNQNPNQASPYTWYMESMVGNPDVHWETALKNNYGLEMGLFKNLISINADYFTENRTGILLPGSSRASIPPFFGATPPTANVGQVKAHGHEIEVKFDKRISNGFRYWASFATTHTINKVLAKDDPALLAAYMKTQGYQINQTRSQIRTGFYNNWDQIFASIPQANNDLLKLPGFYNIADFNADGIINSEDAAPIGYPETPQNTYNVSLGADYKGFSVMVQFYGVNNVSRNIPLWDYKGYMDVLFSHVLDHWSKDNENASSYLPRWKTEAGQFTGDYWIYDGSYLRLKTAEIAYTFSDKFVKRAGLSALRVYLNGENLWFWSDLPDERESSFTGGDAVSGAYPVTKRLNLGIDVTF